MATLALIIVHSKKTEWMYSVQKRNTEMLDNVWNRAKPKYIYTPYPALLYGASAPADQHSKILDASPPSRPNFLHFHAVFGTIWPNNMLPPLRAGAPLWEILDPPLLCYNVTMTITKSHFQFQAWVHWRMTTGSNTIKFVICVSLITTLSGSLTLEWWMIYRKWPTISHCLNIVCWSVLI